MQVAILITTFLRDSLMYRITASIVQNMPDNCILLIADQGYHTTEKDLHYEYLKAQGAIINYLPFDVGLSAARNFLINQANELGIQYCLMSADSIEFLMKYDFNPIIQFLEQEETRGLVGFELEKSKCKWEFNLNLTPEGIHFIPSDVYITEDNIKYMQCEIVRNIFLAKTKSILNIYDEEMKLFEHELMFLDYKKRGYKVFWTDHLIFKRTQSNTSAEYQQYRSRIGEYQNLLKQKLNISNWVIYDKAKKSN